MKKKLYLRITAVALVFIFAISPIKIFAGEKEVEREEKYDNATAYEYILPYTDNNYHLYKFYIYTPTGNGNGQQMLYVILWQTCLQQTSGGWSMSYM